MVDLCRGNRKGIITFGLLIIMFIVAGAVIVGNYSEASGGDCCKIEKVCNDKCCEETEKCIKDECCPENRVCGDECCKGNDACFDGECENVCKEGNFECGIIDLGYWGTFNCGACRACEECDIVYVCKDKCTTPKKCIGEGFAAECEECEDKCRNWEVKGAIVVSDFNLVNQDMEFGIRCSWEGTKICEYTDGSTEGNSATVNHTTEHNISSPVSSGGVGISNPADLCGTSQLFYSPTEGECP